MNHALYSDDKLVEKATTEAMNKGVSIFQMWKHGLTDLEHCRWLLELAQFQLNAHVLDIGCGTGQVAHLMEAIRLDLTFSLQNISTSQLNLCPSRMKQYHGDMNTLENVPDKTFDAAMVCYALGHVTDLPTFFKNVKRVLKPNGQVFMYELLPFQNYVEWAWETLGWITHTPRSTAWTWTFMDVYYPSIHELNTTDFEHVCGTKITKEVHERTFPVVYKLMT